MYARVTTIKGPADRVDAAVQHINQVVIPEARSLPGFKGGAWLASEAAGKVMAVTFWASEDEMLATESTAGKLREKAAKTVGGTITSVEHFEVIAQA